MTALNMIYRWLELHPISAALSSSRSIVDEIWQWKRCEVTVAQVETVRAIFHAHKMEERQ